MRPRWLSVLVLFFAAADAHATSGYARKKSEDVATQVASARAEQERRRARTGPAIFAIGSDGKIYRLPAERDFQARPTVDLVAGALDAQGPQPRWR